MDRTVTSLPSARGLYDPTAEHDACGVSFVVNMKGQRSHDIVKMGIGALNSLEHRGAAGADPDTGDGAGMLLQVPDAFYRAIVDFELPPERHYLTGIAFLPQDAEEAEKAIDAMERLVADEGLKVLGWREVPFDDSTLGAGSRKVMPRFRQIFIDGGDLSGLDLDRRGYVLRKRFEHEVHLAAGTDEVNEAMGGASAFHDGVYFPSLSSRTIVYKGMLTTPQLSVFYPDLNDERVVSAISLVHSRFSTNTFPSWTLAHPYRFVAHNGEINTVQGNENWMRAREALLSSPYFGDDMAKLFPICTPGSSDTARFDEALELLIMAGYSLPEAGLTLIPEPWENNDSMDDTLRAFYRYNASRMEPWDGPASVAFTDGDGIAAVLDRNGLRPSRYWVTDDDLVIMASEVGVIDVDPAKIVEKGRLQPGRMFYIDLTEGRIVRDHELKAKISQARPYRDWLNAEQVKIDQLPPAQPAMNSLDLHTAQAAFGYSHEDLKLLLAPMARDGKEAIGSMGTDTPIAVLSQRPRLLYDYFQQLFAQVTNPPLDAMREEIVTATYSWLGSEANLLEPTQSACTQIMVEHPVLTNAELATIAALNGRGSFERFHSVRIEATYVVAGGADSLQAALESLRKQVTAAVESGVSIIILSDRRISAERAPIPMLLAIGTAHHHLVSLQSRAKVGLIAETGEAREIHHFCTLLGYGANAVNPYLAFDSVSDLINNAMYGLDADLVAPEVGHANLVKAGDKGVLKVMSKMGISTVKSYIGAQIFEAIGIGDELLNTAFIGTKSRLGGIGFAEVHADVMARHRRAFAENHTELVYRDLEVGGEYQWRREGEYHLFNPETVFKLQHSTREGSFKIFQEYTARVDDHAKHLGTLRGLFTFNHGVHEPVPIDEVESVEEIVKRFATGAMSYGSISQEAHETLAIAMNRIGGKSNTGEGGENPLRNIPDENGDSRRSAIKQAASGRFGVTSLYLTEADDIQIKMAQGAKPGEGGQLPGHKVWPWIAEVRHSTPGVGLISPPPHHDIYSIEDLAQLIHDLKNANPSARIHVKLVSEFGVGTVAAGVSKAHSDVVLISGHDGGTGASPLTSLKHTGTPWELGLAETQQTLLLNNLRDRIVVQVDGQLKTGRDVMIAALLGAEEFGFATAPLVVMGCVMMRVCHLDTCPVGVATQNPELRQFFSGRAEHVVNFMYFIAEEVRALLASLGLRSIQEAVGRVDLLNVGAAVDHWKAAKLDLSPILHHVEAPEGSTRYCSTTQDHGLDKALDQKLIVDAADAVANATPISLEYPISNVNRTVGTMLGHEITKKWGAAGLPDDTIDISFTGSAGNSFGAFVPKGVTLRLTGDANDYVGKGLSGGRIVVAAPATAGFVPADSIIAGNVLLYGATAGEAYFNGLVGERFCVRNSGATAVVEGVGDHGCEYMTGGKAVILGPTGRNFGAGMSGGIAYVWDVEDRFESLVNYEMVDLEDLGDDDLEWLKATVEAHHELTGSTRAKDILGDWENSAKLFRKVMPKDFKRVASALAKARMSGEDPDLVVMAAARG